MGIEFELKFRATPEQLAAIGKDISAPQQHFEMQTTYYDTPEGALSDRFYTLRCRLENGIGVCTFKYPAGEQDRGEAELQCENIRDAIPELCKLSGVEELASLTTAGIVPVCGAKFTRIAKTVQMEDCTVEIALDSGILHGGEKTVPLYEVEVELKAGSRQAATAYATALAFRYGLQQETHSKFRRALALAQGE